MPWWARTALGSRRSSRSSPDTTPRTPVLLGSEAGARPATHHRQASGGQRTSLCPPEPWSSTDFHCPGDHSDRLLGDTSSSELTCAANGSALPVPRESRCRDQPDGCCRRSTPSQQAIVAIARALQNVGAEPAGVVLDEPTASLGRADSDRLFKTLEALKAQGHAILFIPHRLDEVLTTADRVDGP